MQTLTECPNNYDKVMDIAMTNDKNNNFDTTTKTTLIKHPHDLLMDIMATNNMNNRIKMKIPMKQSKTLKHLTRTTMMI